MGAKAAVSSPSICLGWPAFVCTYLRGFSINNFHFYNMPLRQTTRSEALCNPPRDFFDDLDEAEAVSSVGRRSSPIVPTDSEDDESYRQYLRSRILEAFHYDEDDDPDYDPSSGPRKPKQGHTPLEKTKDILRYVETMWPRLSFRQFLIAFLSSDDTEVNKVKGDFFRTAAASRSRI
jgi:hypothetical protein